MLLELIECAILEGCSFKIEMTALAESTRIAVLDLPASAVTLEISRRDLRWVISDLGLTYNLAKSVWYNPVVTECMVKYGVKDATGELYRPIIGTPSDGYFGLVDLLATIKEILTVQQEEGH